MSALSIIGHVLMGAGGLILFASGLGVLRFPDVFNRMHASTMSTTLGTILFILGIGCLEPVWLPKLLLIIVLVILTNPVAAHALARAVHMGSQDERPDNLVRDDLQSERRAGEELDE